jgi:phosphotriesterase-related protein
MSELSQAHIRSGMVMTVAGPIPVSDLGLTLMHEHILNDCRCWWHAPKTPEQYMMVANSFCERSWSSPLLCRR